jgi:serine/threonine-protein kinase
MATAPANTPERIGRYRIVSVLGRGAMGVVYKGHDDSIDRPVAIKTIRPELLEADGSGEWLERFQREARAAGRCQHRGIVAIYELGEAAGAPFLAMEFVEGRPLEATLRDQGALALTRATNIITQVLDALGYAHGKGVVHRDVKPANIMLVNGSSVKVADFGVARLDTLHMTRDGMMVGTPSYMAPEQFTGGAVDHRTDLYAAGVVLYEMLSGRRPFEGKSTAELMYQVAHSNPPPLSRMAPGVGSRFDTVLMRALTRDPDARFQSAGAFVRALSRTLEETASAPTDRADQTLVAPASHQPPPPAPTPAPPAWQSQQAATLVSSPGWPPPPAPAWPAPGPQQMAPWPPPPAPGWTPSSSPSPILHDASARRVIDGLAADLTALTGQGGVSILARAAAQASTLEELCRLAATEIGDTFIRQVFLEKAAARIAGHGNVAAAPMSPPAPTPAPASPPAPTPSLTTTSMFGQAPPGASVSPQLVERATRALAEFVGPIARIHVRNAIAGAMTDDQFLRTLAAHLDTEAERGQFMAKARGR